MSSFKWKSGDRICVSSNGAKGTILSTSVRPNTFERIYTLKWDHNFNCVDYKADLVENIWEQEGGSLPKGSNVCNEIELDLGEVKAICFPHEWISYHGFTEVYEYCKYCDEKKVK